MRKLLAAAMTALLVAPALGADGYDRTEHIGPLESRLIVPAAAMALPAVKAAVFARYRDGLKAFEKDALTPQVYDETWRVSYESPKLISLTAEIFWDGGGAHPNSEFATLIWDKATGGPVSFAGLFRPQDLQAAQNAIAKAGLKAWIKMYAARAGMTPSPDLKEMASEGIAADPEHLRNVALYHEAGQSQASGLLLLYGAGEIWPHVVGDFRIPVRAEIFARYLKPDWRSEFR